jgi:hypothetical protein
MSYSAKSSGWLGYGELDTFTFGEDYAPQQIDVDETLQIYESFVTVLPMSIEEFAHAIESESTGLLVTIIEDLDIDTGVSGKISILIEDPIPFEEFVKTTIISNVDESVGYEEGISEIKYQITEVLSFGESVICTILSPITEIIDIPETHKTTIKTSVYEDIPSLETVTSPYLLSVEEFLSIVETLYATTPRQYKRIRLHCNLDTPKIVTLNCHITE